jgi:glycosyltransferase involved in cell wall biosynthesis
MRQTLDSVIAQSLKPMKWVIVDDGSTDETARVLAEYASKYDWIQIVTRADRGHRAVGPGVIDAFYSGYEAIEPEQYDFLCKLDLDLRLPPRYFEILIGRMNADPRIATCSGKSYILEGSRLIDERHGDDTSLGMTKLYRVDCFQRIGVECMDGSHAVGMSRICGLYIFVRWDRASKAFIPGACGMVMANISWVRDSYSWLRVQYHG